MDAVDLRIEEHCSDKTFPVNLLLLFDHAVESADRVALQPAHGTAAVQNKYEFGNVVFHEKISFTVF